MAQPTPEELRTIRDHIWEVYKDLENETHFIIALKKLTDDELVHIRKLVILRRKKGSKYFNFAISAIRSERQRRGYDDDGEESVDEQRPVQGI